jgi:hypothetical protein
MGSAVGVVFLIKFVVRDIDVTFVGKVGFTDVEYQLRLCVEISLFLIDDLVVRWRSIGLFLEIWPFISFC